MTKKEACLILGIEDEYTMRELKMCYSSIIKQYHPEEHPAKFIEIQKAYDVLKNDLLYPNDISINKFMIQNTPEQYYPESVYTTPQKLTKIQEKILDDIRYFLPKINKNKRLLRELDVEDIQKHLNKEPFLREYYNLLLNYIRMYPYTVNVDLWIMHRKLHKDVVPDYFLQVLLREVILPPLSETNEERQQRDSSLKQIKDIDLFNTSNLLTFSQNFDKAKEELLEQIEMDIKVRRKDVSDFLELPSILSKFYVKQCIRNRKMHQELYILWTRNSFRLPRQILEEYMNLFTFAYESIEDTDIDREYIYQIVDVYLLHFNKRAVVTKLSK